MKQYADLTYVPPEQRPLDLRLHNWARWATVHGARFIQPMFRLYRPEEMRDEDRHQGRSAPIDASDALKIEKAVVQLPDKHKLAVIWAYRSRANTRQACEIIGVSRHGLARLIVEAREKMMTVQVVEYQMRLHEIALAAMKAGLRGAPLPNLGRLTIEQMTMVNAIYDEARNWAAGASVKAAG